MKMHPVFKLALLLIILFSLTSPPGIAPAAGETDDPWWDDAWPYRVLVEVEGSGTASVNLYFTTLFSDLGVPGALLDLRSIRVVPYPNGQPGHPLPYQETYSTSFIDTTTLNKDPGLALPYWSEEENAKLDLNQTPIPDGTSYIHAHIDITDISNEKTGFLYNFIIDEPVNWSAYETLLYEVWPKVDERTVDQTPDLYQFELGGLGNCPIKYINGPALAMDRWNAATVSLKPFGRCLEPNLSAMNYLKFYVMVNRLHTDEGNFDLGDKLDLWLDNFRLVDQAGDGEIIWETEPGVNRYYIYFDTLNHEGHPTPVLADLGDPTIQATSGSPQAGGYFHQLTAASTGSLTIWKAPITEKIFKTQQAPVATHPLQIFAALGEFEPFQLVVRSPIDQFMSVSISDFSHQDGHALIPAGQVELFRVDYITLTHISDQYGRPVPWPDPLYPVTLGEEILFPAGQNQPLWFRIRVPRSAQPGIYNAVISIGSASIPLTLEVWPFSLPGFASPETRVGFDTNAVMNAYRGTDHQIPASCKKLLENVITKSLSDYRLTGVPPGQPGFTNNDLHYTLTSYEINQAQAGQLTGKKAWWEFSPYDHPPLPNPAVIDRPGTDARILPWLAWLDRMDGLYYPHINNWEYDPWQVPYLEPASNGHGYLFYPPKDQTIGFDPCHPDSNRLIPSIRLELLREGLEDYAYLWLLNGGPPVIGQPNHGDAIADGFIHSRTAYNRNPIVYHQARLEIASLIPPKDMPRYYFPLFLR